ncbi:MAG: hypothetical protein GC146_11975 [Limimaricola sp.]|uniref:hypothetical protein n=1 Tax=Limimaricola sp. TaxID=2211665 RepID=UPI001DD72056|nr:hypothetical protein [Limimaricola sp.]MBI1417932.1 hypothetical protein [Limimaricola sp.]
MRHATTPRLALVAALCSVAAVANAGPPAPSDAEAKLNITPLGTITAQRDGADEIWQPWIHHGRSQSGFHDDYDGTSVAIFGWDITTLHEGIRGYHGISIGFTVGGLGTNNPQALHPTVTMLDDLNWTRYNYTSEGDGSATITLTKAEMDGDRLHLAGTIEATLLFRITGKDSSDPDKVSHLTGGQFDVWLPED